MKPMPVAFKVYNKETQDELKPLLVRLGKGGRMRFSIHTAKIIGVKAGDKIEVLSFGKDWYIAITNSVVGYPVSSIGGRNGLSIQCSTILHRIMQDLKTTDCIFEKTNLEYKSLRVWKIIKRIDL